MGLYFKGIDVSTPENQYKMLKSLELVLEAKKFNASTTSFLSNWLISFNLWAQDKNETVVMPVRAL